MTAVLRGAFATAKQNTKIFSPLPHMAEYIEQLTAEHCHPKHIAGMRMALLHFANFVKPLGVSNQYDIERRHLVRFQGWVNEQPWAKSYQAQTMKRLRSWFIWLEGCGYLDASETPWVNIRVSTVKKKPNPLSDDELMTLFHMHRQGAFNQPPFIFHRREMILCLLYGWGLRIHELVALDLSDMDIRKDFVRTINKGGGAKTLPYTEEMKKVYARWSSARIKYANRDEQALLINRSGERLPQDEVYKMVTELGQRGGIRINPHRLRDTCGTNMLDDDVPVERVAQILGHTDIKQTLLYSKVNNRKVHESHTKSMNPRLIALFHNTRDLRPPKDTP